MEDDFNPGLSEHQISKCIIALLLALADFSERACHRSLAFCALIVWVLRPAEAAASARRGLEPDATPPPFACSVGVRTDAMRLARRFRALAHEMLREAELEMRFATWELLARSRSQNEQRLGARNPALALRRARRGRTNCNLLRLRDNLACGATHRLNDTS